MITYNQKAYIKEAVEGVLMQKTNFRIELIIGDDCSTDGTRDLLIKYRERYPKVIRLILHPQKNEGIPGKMNFLSTLHAATGKYVALCDGDDYWTDRGKLQKQVDFLETNPEYAICCHRVYIKKGKKKPKLDDKNIFAPVTEATYDIGMMAKYGNLTATPSVVYRNKLFSSFPTWFNQSPIGDYVLHMLNAQYGKIKYFPEPMAVYRDHSTGAWGGKTVKVNAAGMMKALELLLTEPFNEPVKEGLREQLRNQKATYLNELVKEDWDFFYHEFNRITKEDKGVPLALIEKMKNDMDAFRGSRTYRAMDKLKRMSKS
ncbi:MAG: glycosyltransferase [Bacteroidota bacterium]|nr:glycosyltransferase [Bacteroidota bacterium]